MSSTSPPPNEATRSGPAAANSSPAPTIAPAVELERLFGGLAKAERNRIRHRVRAAMAAHVFSGRWLGGRPPYGYQLVDAGPHPNPDKAAAGVRLHALDPDPVTAPIVDRIFDLYVGGGLGFKAIAALLNADGVPCPSAHGRPRNSHRSGHAWASSAVRAILANPRYLGRHVFGVSGDTSSSSTRTSPPSVTPPACAGKRQRSG